MSEYKTLLWTINCPVLCTLIGGAWVQCESLIGGASWHRPASSDQYLALWTILTILDNSNTILDNSDHSYRYISLENSDNSDWEQLSALHKILVVFPRYLLFIANGIWICDILSCKALVLSSHLLHMDDMNTKGLTPSNVNSCKYSTVC